MNGLRVSEACETNIEDVGFERGHRTLKIIGKATRSKIITAEELENMTPAERRAVFEASIVTDLDDAPPELLARTRQRTVSRLR